MVFGTNTAEMSGTAGGEVCAALTEDADPPKLIECSSDVRVDVGIRGTEIGGNNGSLDLVLGH